jgi:thioredoxin reductase
MDQPIDGAIIGAGIAGLSAALFLGRAGRSTIVYDGGEPRIFAVDEVREYLGFDAMPPSELMKRARAEVLRYGVEIRQEKVIRVIPRDDGFFDVTSDGSTIIARTVVLATGLIDERPPLTGVPKAWGRDLRVCPCFDGYEVRDGRYVVFGLPERLAHMASWVRMWSPDVTVVSLHTFNETEAERLRLLDIKITSDEVTGLVHEGNRLVAVTTKAGNQIACDATWIAMNARAASDLAASLCDVDEAGFAKTDAGGKTSRPGVFAIGNANEPWAHLAHAAASGTTVGPIVTMYLLEQLVAERRASEAAGIAA